LEKRYGITRKCLELLVQHDWPVTIQTKSPLVLRDLDILKQARDVEVGFTITTAHDKMRKLFEPGAPSVQDRIEAVAKLHAAGISTFVMIAPILPGAEGLIKALAGKVDHAVLDRLNYHYADRVYKLHGLEWAKENEFFSVQGEELQAAFERAGIPCNKVF